MIGRYILAGLQGAAVAAVCMAAYWAVTCPHDVARLLGVSL